MPIAQFVVLLMLAAIPGWSDPPAPSSSVLPAEIQTTLDHEYPGWKLAPVNQQIQQEFKKHPVGHPPSLVWGDFDQDGKRDYVVQILLRSPDLIEQILIAFIQRENSFEEMILESRGPNPNIYLGIIKKADENLLIVMGAETGETTYGYANGRFTEMQADAGSEETGSDDPTSNP